MYFFFSSGLANSWVVLLILAFSGGHTHPDEVLSEVITRVDRAAAARISDIRAVAQLVLPEDRYIDVRLVPIDFDE